MLPLSASAEAVAHSPRSRARERRGGLTGIELDRRMREILIERNARNVVKLSGGARRSRVRRDAIIRYRLHGDTRKGRRHMAKVTDEAKKKQLTVYLPDTRGVTISRFGIGNLKIGLGVFTYSRLPGDPKRYALGLVSDAGEKKGGLPHDCGDDGGSALNGTCPGATKECQSICYAARPVTEAGPVAEMWARNSSTEDVPMELPPDAKLVRLHISGDFSSRGYIDGWFALFASRPDVRMWAYTRSWRVASLLPALDRLRALPNVQLFASVDSTTPTSEIESITAEYEQERPASRGGSHGSTAITEATNRVWNYDERSEEQVRADREGRASALDARHEVARLPGRDRHENELRRVPVLLRRQAERCNVPQALNAHALLLRVSRSAIGEGSQRRSSC
jgi:hypothetical protein